MQNVASNSSCLCIEGTLTHRLSAQHWDGAARHREVLTIMQTQAAPHLTASGLWASFQTLLVMNSRGRLPCCISSCNPSPTTASLPYEAVGTTMGHSSSSADGETYTMNSSAGSTPSSVPVACEGCRHSRSMLAALHHHALSSPGAKQKRPELVGKNALTCAADAR